MESEDCRIFHVCQEPECSFTTSWVFAMNHHAKTHQQKKSISSRRIAGFDCRTKLQKHLCDYESYFKVNMAIHSRSHYDWTLGEYLRAPKDEELMENGGRCEKCGFESASNFLLQVHIFHCSSDITTKKVEEVIELEESTILAAKKNNLPDPIDCVNEQGLYQCNFCRFTSKYRHNVTYHQKTIHSCTPKVQWFHCPHCKYKSKRSVNIKIHVYIQHSSETNPAQKVIKHHQCSQCAYRTKRIDDLLRHFICKHPREESVKWLKCDRCSFRTKTSNNYRKHLKSAHGSEEDSKWFHCAHCEFKCKRKWYLNQVHNKRYHSR